MAFSGTISETLFTTTKVIETAARRCKVAPSTLTADSVEMANNALYLLLSDLANQGAPLWCIEKELYPLYDGVDQIIMAKGTVDVLNGNLRRLMNPGGTPIPSDTVYEMDYGDSFTMITTVGIKWLAPAIPVTFERSDTGDDWDWSEVDAVVPVADEGQWTWFDVPVLQAFKRFRVRATDGLTPISYDKIVFGNTPTEVPLGRLNRDDYTSLPNKTFKSNQPLQYWFDRQVRLPVMHLWPVPNAASEFNQITIWRQRHIMDVGAMQQEIEVPQRWYEAIVSMLASKLALELPEVPSGLGPVLDGKAAAALNVAQSEERDNSPIFMAPNISPYTR